MKKSKNIKVVWSLLKKHKLIFCSCVLLMLVNSLILGGVMSSVLPVISSQMTSDGGSAAAGYFGKILIFYHKILPESESRKLISIVLLFCMIVINATVELITIMVNSSLTVKLTCDCRSRVYDSIQNMKFSVLERYPYGELVQLLITETRSVYAVFKQILSVISTSLNVLVLILLLFLLSWRLSMILLTGGFFLMLINLFLVNKIKILGKTALTLRTQLTTQATDTICGMKQLKLMQAESMISERFRKTSRKSETTARRIVVKTGFQAFITGNISVGIVFAVISSWYFFPVFSEGIPSAAGLITFLILMGKLAPSIGSISKEYGSISANMPALSKVGDFILHNTHHEDGGTYEPNVFLKDKISFKNVCFEYSSEKPIFSGLNTDIKRGSYIGIVGPSGEGKSTLLNLFLRIYDPTSGQILIDGINIKDFKLSYLRSHIGLLSQDFFLFNTSIRENLLIAKPDASEDELIAVLTKAGLIDFLYSLDDGLDSQIGNNGEKLSGGQRQRLSLAIIFLLNPDVIILDEGTSAVDKDTEIHILKSLREFHKGGKTIVSSAHKETALVDAEYIYKLSNGSIQLLDQKLKAS